MLPRITQGNLTISDRDTARGPGSKETHSFIQHTDAHQSASFLVDAI